MNFIWHNNILSYRALPISWESNLPDVASMRAAKALRRERSSGQSLFMPVYVCIVCLYTVCVVRCGAVLWTRLWKHVCVPVRRLCIYVVCVVLCMYSLCIRMICVMWCTCRLWVYLWRVKWWMCVGVKILYSVIFKTGLVTSRPSWSSKISGEVERNTERYGKKNIRGW